MCQKLEMSGKSRASLYKIDKEGRNVYSLEYRNGKATSRDTEQQRVRQSLRQARERRRSRNDCGRNHLPLKQSMNRNRPSRKCKLRLCALSGVVAVMILSTSTFRLGQTALWTLSERLSLTIFSLQYIRIKPSLIRTVFDQLTRA